MAARDIHVPLGASFPAAAAAALALAFALAPGVERKLQRDVEAALAATVGARGMSVEMRGRRADLVGEALDPSAVEAAAQAALRASGRGGTIAGGIASVNADALRVILPAVAEADLAAPLSPAPVASEADPNLSDPGVTAGASSKLAASAGENAENPLTDDPAATSALRDAPVGRPGDAAVEIADVASDAGGPVAACRDRLAAVGSEDGVSFVRNSERPSPNSVRYLEAAAGALKQCGAVRIVVGGHTDSTGSERVNRRLSLARAQNIRDILAGFGLPRRRVEAVGYGSSRPAAPPGTPDAAARNRRVTIEVSAIEDAASGRGGSR